MSNVEKPAPPVHPQPVLQMRITVMADGNVSVSGFPTSLRDAQNLLNMAAQATIEYFIDQAKAGTLDDNNTVIPKKIIEPMQFLHNGRKFSSVVKERIEKEL
jgi:hypothetical protein